MDQSLNTTVHATTTNRLLHIIILLTKSLLFEFGKEVHFGSDVERRVDQFTLLEGIAEARWNDFR
jgi:hypothetical protein